MVYWLKFYEKKLTDQERFYKMRRKHLFMALMCAVSLTMTSVMPMVSIAEETEAVTESAEDATEGAEKATEAPEGDSEAETGDEAESETEEPLELVERPDYQASEYVELGEYKGLTVQVSPLTVSDEEVVRQIRANGGSDILEEITEGTVELGDTANIDYEGKLDGVAFDGGTAQDYDLEIGSGTFIDGFEDGLVGVAVGETVDLPLTFPENYTEELAGKDVIFTVTVNSVKRMPELTSEVVDKITDGEYSDVDTYKESVRAELLQIKEDSRESEINNALLTQIASASTIKDYPQELVDYVVANMTNYYKQYADMYSMEFEEFLDSYMGLTEEEFEAQAELAAKQGLQAELYLKAIAEKEGIELSDEEYTAKCQEYADRNGYSSVEEFTAAYEESEIRLSALQEKVLAFITENATVEEQTEAESESDGASEGESEAVSEGQSEEVSETESETAAESGTEAESEGESEAE